MPTILWDREPTSYEYAGAAGGFWDKDGFPYCRGRILNHLEQKTDLYNHTIPCYWTSGAAMLVRRAVFLAHGGFDADYFAHHEEIDWCWRMINKGYYHVCVHNSHVYHLGGASLAYGSPRKVFLNFRNNKLSILKNHRGSLLMVGLRRFFLECLACLSFWSAPKSLWAVIRSWMSCIKRFSQYKKIRQADIRLDQPRHKVYHDIPFDRISIIFQFHLKRRNTFEQIKVFLTGRT